MLNPTWLNLSPSDKRTRDQTDQVNAREGIRARVDAVATGFPNLKRGKLGGSSRLLWSVIRQIFRSLTRFNARGTRGEVRLAELASRAAASRAHALADHRASVWKDLRIIKTVRYRHNFRL